MNMSARSDNDIRIINETFMIREIVLCVGFFYMCVRLRVCYYWMCSARAKWKEKNTYPEQFVKLEKLHLEKNLTWIGAEGEGVWAREKKNWLILESINDGQGTKRSIPNYK